MSNTKVRFGVVGTNTITDKFIAGASQDPRFMLVAVCSRTQERANEFASKHGIPYTFTSLEEMASGELIDAVYIATPTSLHAVQSVLCMRCGKHVLCEKPFASNVSEAKVVIAAAQQYGVTFMEAMIATLNPNFRIVKEALDKLGTLRRYTASYCQYSSRYDKFKEGIVLNAFKPEFSNGAVMDIGIYTIYPMVALWGRPKTIQAHGLLLSTGVDGQGTVHFGYDGMEATVFYSKIADSFLPSEIEGENGSLLLDRIHVIREVTHRLRRSVDDGPGYSIGIPLNHDIYFYETEEFINLIQQGKIQSEVNSHSCSLITLEILDEIRRQIGVVYPADKVFIC